MIRIGSRGSDLALWQARHIAACLAQAGEESEIIVLVTRGDRIDDVPLQSVEGKGFFTKELEDALLEERIDLAVHSHKDLPSATIEGLVIAAVPPRAALEERLLVAPAAHDPEALFLPLKRGARVGTSAPRRTAQLAALRADLELLPLRGNVPTRVRRLREGRYDAILLAAAGLDRLQLDLDGLEVVTLPGALFVPAPAQGALAIQTRANDLALRALCERVLHSPLVAATIAAERALLVRLGGGCNLPLGVMLEQLDDDGSDARWRAHAFLGAEHPRPDSPARWCHVVDMDPATAADALATRLLQGLPTGQGPLEGVRIALSGARDSLAELGPRLTTLGALVQREELIEIEDLEAHDLEACMARLVAGDLVALTSANAARRLRGARVPEGVRLAAVGSATARALREAGFAADHVGRAGARELARELELAAGARVLFPCAEHALPALEEELARRGVAVERLALYRTRPKPGSQPSGDAHVRLYLSPSAVAAARAWEEAQRPAARRVALGPSTSEALAAAGLAHTTAASPELEDVLAALVRAATEEPRR